MKFLFNHLIFYCFLLNLKFFNSSLLTSTISQITHSSSSSLKSYLKLTNFKSSSISTELYLYSWPLIMSRLTRKSMFYCPDNRMMPLPVFPNPNLTAIVRPNVDTLYDACWIDHTKEEDLLLTIPNTEEGLYFLFPLMVIIYF